jgi:metallophosphoesterase superfamily enzyme
MAQLNCSICAETLRVLHNLGLLLDGHGVLVVGDLRLLQVVLIVHRKGVRSTVEDVHLAEDVLAVVVRHFHPSVEVVQRRVGHFQCFL